MRGMVNRLSGAGRPTQEMMQEKNGRLLVETRSNQKRVRKNIHTQKGTRGEREVERETEGEGKQMGRSDYIYSRGNHIGKILLHLVAWTGLLAATHVKHFEAIQ
jgi:hypothetical protein